MSVSKQSEIINKLCARPPQYASCKLTIDLLTLKLVSELRVTWTTFVPILVFRGLSVLDFGPIYATDIRHTDNTSDANHCLMPYSLVPYGGGRIIIK